MAIRSGQARIVGAILAGSRCAGRPGAFVRHVHSQQGPSKQAALINDLSSSPSSSSIIPDLSVKGKALKELQHEQSGLVVKVYPSSVSLQGPSQGLHEEFHFDHIWLRDICTEENSVEKDTKQKLFHTSDVHIPGENSQFGLLAK
jgi:hypothetical protein